MEEKENISDEKGKKKEFPLISLLLAEGVLKEIYSAGGQVPTSALPEMLGVKGGALARKISSTKRWNLIKGVGKIFVTELGKKILHPKSDEELLNVRRESFFSVKLFKEIYERFGNKLPNTKTFIAILVREYNLIDKDAKTILTIYREAISLYLPDKENESNNLRKEESSKPPSNKLFSLSIEAPLGKFKLEAKDKAGFKKLRIKLEEIWDMIENFWPEEDIEKKNITETENSSRNDS